MYQAQEKETIRKDLIKQREVLSSLVVRQKSGEIAKKIFSMPEWKEADIIYTYASVKNEPDTFDIMQNALDMGKRVCTPKIFGKSMQFIEIKSLDDLKPGTWGLMEPEDKGVYVDTPCFMILPGISFGRDFNRVGYGAGYYDRYFDKHKEGDGWFLVAVCYDFQLKDKVPHEKFDVLMDVIVSENELLRRI